MQIVIATDIFGRTSHVNQTVERMTEKSLDPLVLDPYGGELQSFSDEDTAYDAFVVRCGHERYLKLVQTVISGLKEPVVLVGFSAGATALWRSLDAVPSPKVLHLIGYYPGQIRNHLSLSPTCETTLIFPEKENHFSVDQVMADLKGIRQVQCYRVRTLHGFMNKHSVNYDKVTSDKHYLNLENDRLCSDPVLFRYKLFPNGRES